MTGKGGPPESPPNVWAHELGIFAQQPRVYIAVEAMVLTAVIAYADYVTGPFVPLAVFQIVPIFMSAFFLPLWFALGVATAAAGSWYWVDAMSIPASEPTFIRIWDFGVKWIFFAIMVLTFRALHQAAERRHQLAGIDDLTQVSNRRTFMSALESEMRRLTRYAQTFSIAYFDCDDFKNVNDAFGHVAGDSLLQAIAAAAMTSVRDVDTFARVGGDEFAMLLPMTNLDTAVVVVQRVQEAILEAIVGRWPSSVTIGVVTFQQAPPSAIEAIAAADTAMYQAKRVRKGTIGKVSFPA